MLSAAIDFETASESPLPMVGQTAYAMHKSTRLLCMAYRISDDVEKRTPQLSEVKLWQPGQPFPVDLQAAIDAGARMRAHNAAFENAVWTHTCVQKYGFPELPVSRWSCSAALAAYHGLPRSLAGAAKALGIKAQKDAEGHKLMLRLCKPLPVKQRKNGKLFDNDPEKIARVCEYCRQDVLVESQIETALGHDLPRPEQQIWVLDQEINRRGLPVDLQSIAGLIRFAGAYAAELNAELKKLTGGCVESLSQRERLFDWIRANGYPELEDLRASTLMACLRRGNAPAPVQRAMEIRRAGARSSVAKLKAMIQRAVKLPGDDPNTGRICDAHMYYGAHTGRWAGRGVQLQNVPRGTVHHSEHELAIELICNDDRESLDLLYGDRGDVLVSLLRPMLCAPKGRELVVCDFSGIEARVLAWLSNHQDLITAISNGDDVYRLLAAKIYDLPGPEDVTSKQRFVGKVAVLGLGYGMGAEKVEATCENFRLELEEDMAQRVVDVYRSVNSPIVEWWNQLNLCARKAVSAKSVADVGRNTAIFYYSESGSGPDNRVLVCELPSGRRLRYREPKFVPVKDPERPWAQPELQYRAPNGSWAKLYGGKIAENVVQAVARDLLAEALVRVNSHGVKIVGHVHDEIICEAKEGELSIERLKEWMCERPTWAYGCPIDGEGYVARRYRK